MMKGGGQRSVSVEGESMTDLFGLEANISPEILTEYPSVDFEVQS